MVQQKVSAKTLFWWKRRPGGDGMPIKVRGIEFESNLDNPMGLEFYNLSHRFGFQSPNWPYFEDVKIERIHYMAKSGVLYHYSCTIPPGEVREIINRSNSVCKMLVVIPYPPGVKP
jgi:hypothetical protein